jgi:hypothetical protein
MGSANATTAAAKTRTFTGHTVPSADGVGDRTDNPWRHCRTCEARHECRHSTTLSGSGTSLREGLSVKRTAAAGCAVAACLIAVPAALAAGIPTAQAKNGDTHIIGVGIVQTLDCNGSTLFVNGAGNVITAIGVCWAVTMQGSSNTVVADTVINDVTVYGWNQTVLFHNGEPFILDRGRELGMVNRIDQVPA